MIEVPGDNFISENESIKGKCIISLCLMGGYLRNIAIALLLAFIGICFLSQVIITSNPTLAQTMTINNVTGATHDNATGRVVVKNVGDTTNPSALLAKAISNIPGNTTSLKSGINQTHWWQYNAGSRLAP
jgi:hypothetical protein